MADNTVTLVLNGEVPLAEFAQAISNFSELIRALTDELGQGQIDWVIDDLQYSSGMVTAAGRGERKAVEMAVLAYGQVASSMEGGRPIAFSAKVSAPALRLARVVD